MLERRALGRMQFVARPDVAEFERAIQAQPALHLLRQPASSSGGRGCSGSRSSGSGTSGIVDWCSTPGSSTWNETDAIQDRLAVLDRQHAPRRETAAVARALHANTRSALRCRPRAGNTRAANAPRVARPRFAARPTAPGPAPGRRTRNACRCRGCAPRNRLSSSRSSCSSSTSSATRGLVMKFSSLERLSFPWSDASDSVESSLRDDRLPLIKGRKSGRSHAGIIAARWHQPLQSAPRSTSSQGNIGPGSRLRKTSRAGSSLAGTLRGVEILVAGDPLQAGAFLAQLPQQGEQGVDLRVRIGFGHHLLCANRTSPDSGPCSPARCRWNVRCSRACDARCGHDRQSDRSPPSRSM